MSKLLVAACLAYCVFELARTVLFCYRSDQIRKEVERMPTRAASETDAYNHMARVMELAEAHREMEQSWWMWPHSRWLAHMADGQAGRGR